MKNKEKFSSILGEYESLIAREDDAYDVIPTGSFSLDLSLGIGGIPTGRFTEIFGSEGTGKTTLSLSICKKALLSGKRVLYVEPENSLSIKFVKSVLKESYSPDNFVLVQTSMAEQSLQICEQGIKDGFDVIFLDSVGALVPEKIMQKELTDSTVALLSSLVTRFLQRNATRVNANNIAFVFINQVRADFKNTFFTTYATPGGHALKHLTSLRISLSRGEKIELNDEIIGVYTKFTVLKNKLAPPFKSFNFPIMFNKNENYPFIAESLDILNLGIIFNVVKQRKGWLYFEDTVLGNGLIKTSNELPKETLDKIKQAVYNVYKEVKEEYKQDERELEDTENL